MKSDPRINIPDLTSSDTVWIQWYKDLKSNLGRRQANSIWVMCWNKRGGKSAKGNTTALRNEMERHDIVIDANIFGSVKDTVSGVTDFFGDIFGGTKILLFVTAGVVVLFLGSIVYRNFKTGDATKILGAALTKNPSALK